MRDRGRRRPPPRSRRSRSASARCARAAGPVIGQTLLGLDRARPGRDRVARTRRAARAGLALAGALGDLPARAAARWRGDRARREWVEALIVGLGRAAARRGDARAAARLAPPSPWPARVTVLAYAIDVVAGSPLTRALAAWGPNPALGVRFFGIGNELEATLAALRAARRRRRDRGVDAVAGGAPRRRAGGRARLRGGVPRRDRRLRAGALRRRRRRGDRARRRGSGGRGRWCSAARAARPSCSSSRRRSRRSL